MTVRPLETTEQLAAVAEQWNLLAAGHAMRGFDWADCWWKHYRSNDELLTLGVFDGPRLVGLAPWRVERTASRGGVIRWIGDGEVCTDHLTLLADEPYCQRVVDEIADYLSDEFDEWDLLQLDDVDADDATLALLADALERRGSAVRQRAAGAYWSTKLPEDWEAFLAGLSKSHRKKLRRAQRAADESGAWDWRRVSNQDEYEQGWRILVDLHQRRWEGVGQPGCFASERFTRFHAELSRRLLDTDQLRLSWIEVEGRPAAAEYDFVGGQSRLAYQSGLEPELMDSDAAKLMNTAAINWAIEEGAAEYDFLRGDEPYKASWRAEPRETVNFQAVPPRGSAQWRAAAGRVAGAVRNGLKSLRGHSAR